jgi:uncharacterized membrane protein
VQAELLVLRLIHIVGGVFWVGSGVFTTFFLLPALGQSGTVAAQVMMGLQRRRVFIVMPIVALLTILSGIRLMMITSGGFSADYFATASGQTYAWSGLAAVISFLLGLAVSRPAAVRVAHLSQSAASDEFSRERLAAEIRSLQRRAAMSGTTAVILLVLSAAGMAVARYL